MLVPLISLDTETTGLEPAVHAPWEIAWCTAIHNTDARTLTLHRRQRSLILLDGTARLDPVALDIGGFQKRYASFEAYGQRMSWWAVQSMLLADLDHLRAIARDGCSIDQRPPAVHLIGAVPQFDHRMLERWFGWAHRHWHYHLIDVETLVAGALYMPPPYDSNAMTERACGPDWVNPWGAQHEALADVRWNLQLYAAAYGLAIDDHTALDGLSKEA